MAASRSAISARHRGQYHGAGCFTGLGLRFRHLAQRYRLPFTAVFGRSLLPVRGMFFGIGNSDYQTIPAAKTTPAANSVPQNPSTTKQPRVVRLYTRL